MPIVACKDPKLPPPLSVPEGSEWSEGLSTLESHTAETLLVIMRTLCPHDALPDRIYRRAVMTLDRLNARLPDGRRMIVELVGMLDRLLPFAFRDAAETSRVEMLRKVETTEAFRFVQGMTVRYLYDDVEVWQAFGYEGASVHLGGYVTRGFDDLDWLPEPDHNHAAL